MLKHFLSPTSKTGGSETLKQETEPAAQQIRAMLAITECAARIAVQISLKGAFASKASGLLF
jgi:hypothetical protein